MFIPFLVSPVLFLSNYNASYCGMFYLLPVVSVWGKLEEIYIQYPDSFFSEQHTSSLLS